MKCSCCEKEIDNKIAVSFPNKTCICVDCVLVCMEIVTNKMNEELIEELKKERDGI